MTLEQFEAQQQFSKLITEYGDDSFALAAFHLLFDWMSKAPLKEVNAYMKELNKKPFDKEGHEAVKPYLANLSKDVLAFARQNFPEQEVDLALDDAKYIFKDVQGKLKVDTDKLDSMGLNKWLSTKSTTKKVALGFGGLLGLGLVLYGSYKLYMHFKK